MTWQSVFLGEIMVNKQKSIDPKKQPNAKFALYSIPGYDAGAPEICKGSEIGSTKKCLEPGDVVLSRIIPHIRRAWVVDSHDVDHIVGSSEWIVFRSSKIYGPYLRHILTADVFHSQFMNTVAGVGGSLVRARPKAAAEIQIPLPPLEEQRRIAGILDAADALRRSRREALSLLDILPGAIFAEMFGDPVVKSHERKFVPLGEITSKIGSGATPRGGANVYQEKGTKFIRSMNVREGAFSEEGMVRISDSAARQLSNVEVTENDVFLNITGASVARCCRSDATLSGARVNQHVAIIRPKNSALTDFIMGALCHPHMNANLLRIAEAGATRQAITKSQIEMLEVPSPIVTEAEEYSTRLLSAKRLRARAFDHLSNLETLFASLQYRAFAGKL